MQLRTHGAATSCRLVRAVGQRQQPTARAVLDDLGASVGLRQSETPFARVVAHAADLKWTRDPFDRLIVGRALADGITLLTADKVIRKHFKQARWA